jgi:hypothetical protein
MVAYPAGKTGWGMAYLTGELDGRIPGRMAYRIYRHTPNDGKVVLVDVGTNVDHSVMLHVAVLHRHGGAIWNSTYIWGFSKRTAEEYLTLASTQRQFRYRVVSNNPELLGRLRQLAQANPDLQFDVVDERTLPA